MDSNSSKTEKNNFGLKTSISEKELENNQHKIDNDKPHEKYRAKLPCDGKKFQYEDYIKLTGKGYTNKTINLKTFCSYNKDSQPKAVVYLIHGLGAHSTRSGGLATFLADSGYFVCSFDQREHGYSEGDIGYIYTLDDLITDAINFIKLTEQYIEQEFKTRLPKFAMGISMGGLITNYISKQINFNGVIYVAPCFAMKTGSLVNFGISSIAFFFPTKVIPQNKESLVFKNPVFKEQPCPIQESRLPTFGTINAIKSKCEEFSKEENKSHENSMLFVVSGVEKLVCNYAILNYYNSSKVKDKSMLYYPNMWHGVYLEEEIEDLYPRVSIWINDRLK